MTIQAGGNAMRKSFFLLIFLLPVFLFAQAEKYIQIGSFNMEWFPCKDDGQMMRKYGINLNHPPQGSATDIPAMFAMLKKLDIQLLGVVEIVDTHILQQAAKKYLGESYKLIYAPSNSSQKVGFLYDSALLDTIGKPQIYMDVALSPDSWLRPALRVYFKYKKTGFDFNAVIVHLKAAPSGWKKRYRQWNILERILKEIPKQTNDEDLIMMGDFNNVSRLKFDEFKPFIERLHFYWATSELAEQGYPSDFWQPDYSQKRIEGSLIDQMFISQHALTDYVKNSMKVGGMCAQRKKVFEGKDIPEYYETISDHCPIFATFRADKDND